MASFKDRHFSFVLYVIGFCLLVSVQSKEFFCNNRYIDSEDSINIRCFYVSPEPATWNEAFRYCHKRRGWLANNPSRNNQSEHPIGGELLAYNDVSSIWTGLHVQDYRLLEDAFPTPNSVGFISSFPSPVEWDIDLGSQRHCVVEEFYAPWCDPDFAEGDLDFPVEFTENLGNNEGHIPENCLGDNVIYRKKFVSCDEKHIFGCYFSGVDLTTELGVPITVSASNDGRVAVYDPYYLPVQMYLTTEKSKLGDSDDVCARLLERGTTFQETRMVPIDTLNLVAQVFNTTLDAVTQYYSRQLHWIKRNPNECYASTLTFAYSQMNKKYSLMPWACESFLPVVCQRERIYAETTAVVTVIFRDDRLQLFGNELHGPFIAFFEHLTGELDIESENFTRLSLQCSVSSLKRGQRVTTFESGNPVQTYTELPRGLNGFELFGAREVLPSRVDVMMYYYCEVNSEEDNKLISSNRIFLRPTDLLVYSLHIDIFPNVTRSFSFALFGSSLSDRWDRTTDLFPPLNEEEEPDSDQGNVFQRLARIGDSEFVTTPKLFIPGNESRNHKLVFYLYEEASEVPGFGSEGRAKRQADNGGDNPVRVEALGNERQLLDNQNFIRTYLLENAPSLSPLNVTSAKLLSIDYCWGKTVYENVTNRNYTLTDSREGFVYRSPQTCAQDNRPLVTVECRGDKVAGLEWGPLEVNPLCDYSGSDDDGDETEVTQSLQSISQENITADNVDDYLNDTKVLTSILTDETVNTKDILYVADILQKSSDIDNLSPEAAKAILDTVDIVAGLTSTTLTDAQEDARATNRILQSVDKLGAQVDLGKNTDFQRIISGQYGLEVWNLTLDYDDSPIIGLKILPGGRTEAIARDDMVSLIYPNTEYVDAEAAIILPRELIMSILGNDTSDDIKLSMNVYRDTTLYNLSATDNNTTLNSKVIAAQLLLRGQPITDLGPYKVTTIFLPDVEVDEENRSEASVCAYWDFSANLGAGGWATDGCVYDRTEAGRDVCICDHLTNFAVLVNFYSQEYVSDEHQLALSVITIVGLSLSILGLSITILSFLCIKKLRQGRPQQTLFNLALALLMTWIVFLAGIERTESYGGCIAVAALLHYFILASFMWMLMEGILQYLLFVRVMNTYFTKYMWKTGIPAWGLPLIPVLIVFAIDYDLYDGGEEYCWMSLDAFYYAFALPVGLIVMTNLVIFILVVISLCRRKDMSKMSSQSKNHTLVNIRASFICFFVLGLSWVFGFLTIEKARTVFQYIFCILATLQGFIIFLMMTARDKTVQQFWKNLCCRRASKESTYRTSNDKGTGGTSQGTHAIPRLQKDKGGAYQGSNSNTQDTSLTEGSSQNSHSSRSEDIDISYNYDSFAT